MSLLSQLKLVSAKRPTALPSIQIRRNKLSSKLFDQIELAKAMQDGRIYAPKRLRSLRDRNTGETRNIEVVKRVRQMWFVSDLGKVCIQVKYGTRLLELAKGKNAVEVNTADELINVLGTLKSAVENGELDTQINNVIDIEKKSFKK
jgi:hypothetical protein